MLLHAALGVPVVDQAHETRLAAPVPDPRLISQSCNTIHVAVKGQTTADDEWCASTCDGALSLPASCPAEFCECASAKRLKAMRKRSAEIQSASSSRAGDCTPAVTACCKDDGFGAHYYSMVRIFSHAEEHKILYCTSPWGEFGRVNHKADADKLWDFVGGSLFGPDCRSLTVGKGSYCKPEKYLAGPNATVSDEAFEGARLKILAAYHSTPKPYLWDTDTRHLAVHVRRGDVTEEKYGDTDRWVSNKEVAKCITRAFDEMGGDDIDVHIFSEGHAADFDDLKELRTNGSEELGLPPTTIKPVLHLNGDVMETFHYFVSADGFVLGASSLSGAAAYLRGRQDFYTFDFCTRAMFAKDDFYTGETSQRRAELKNDSNRKVPGRVFKEQEQLKEEKLERERAVQETVGQPAAAPVAQPAAAPAAVPAAAQAPAPDPAAQAPAPTAVPYVQPPAPTAVPYVQPAPAVQPGPAKQPEEVQAARQAYKAAHDEPNHMQPPAAAASPFRCDGVQTVFVYTNGNNRATVCCASSCGQCGGLGCEDLPGGREQCCTREILDAKRTCSAPGETGCVVP